MAFRDKEITGTCRNPRTRKRRGWQSSGGLNGAAMKKSEVRNLIYEGLKGVLEDHGFRLNRKQEGFVRRIPDGKQCIGVPLVDYNPTYIFSLTLTTRLEAVQTILNLFTGSPPQYHSITVTTITQLDYFTKKKTEYKVETEADISNAIVDLTPLAHGEIIPFLDQHQDAVSWDRAVNSNSNDVCGDSSMLTDRCNSVDNSNHPNRGMAAVVLAHLAGNPNFEDVVRRLRNFYEGSRDATDKLTRLVDYLNQRTK
jgi:hypothetical protein